MAAEKIKAVRFLRDETVHRVGEKPFTYKAGEVYELRIDRANWRIQNGIAVDPNDAIKAAADAAKAEAAKSDGNVVDSSKAVAGTDSSDPGVGTVDEPASSGKGKGK